MTVPVALATAGLVCFGLAVIGPKAVEKYPAQRVLITSIVVLVCFVALTVGVLLFVHNVSPA